jgi:hypothetical protein
VSVSGGYGEVELGWELCVREGEWSGVPVVKGLVVGELSVEVKDVLRVEIGEVNWYGEGRSVLLEGEEVNGLVGRANWLVLRLDADVLSGIGVEGLEVRSEGEGILLFDEDGDGRVDSFYLSGAEVEVGDIAIGSGVRSGGEALLSASGARLSLRGLTTVSVLLEEGEEIGGELRLQARSGRVGVREGVVVEVGESREIGGSEWGLEGVIDVSEKELRVGMERVDGLVGGGEIVKLSADPAGEKGALELRVGLNGEVRDGNELWFELSDMRGEFGVFGGGEGAPELFVESVGVQLDGDVEDADAADSGDFIYFKP